MAGSEKAAIFFRMPDKITRILRVLRRTFYQRSSMKHEALDQIEHRMACSLYRRTAAELGLDAYDIGRVMCIEGRGKRFRVWGCTSEFDNHPLYGITEDKVLIKNLFKDRGLPVPEGRAFDWRDRSAGIQYALSLRRPCVVKPASDTSSGKGVATELTRRSDIARAFRFAGLFSPQVLIEEFVFGDNYRFLIYKGKCVSVLRRELPAVTGDGRATVRELAEIENRNRIQCSDWREGDPQWMRLPTGTTASRYLKRQGLSWRYVPKRGEQIVLSGMANFAFGCTYSEVLGRTHPGQIHGAEEAARFIGITIAGVDIVSPNIEEPAYQILEINIGPGLEIHYALRNPEEAKDPVRIILKDIFGDVDSGSAHSAPPGEDEHKTIHGVMTKFGENAE